MTQKLKFSFLFLIVASCYFPAKSKKLAVLRMKFVERRFFFQKKLKPFTAIRLDSIAYRISVIKDASLHQVKRGDYKI